MSKTIKVIDLLNKIANGEEVPKRIKYKNNIYKYDKEATTYYEINQDKGIYISFDTDELNDTVEIIEEEPEIDIQGLEELNENADEIFNDKYGSLILQNNILQNRGAINQLIKAVKQLDHQINNK